MKILIAPDSFKDALAAPDVCRAIRRGILKARPEADCTLFPLADGGEGTSEILAWHFKDEMIRLTVADPLGRPVEAHYFLAENGRVAFIEMAQASGLQLLRAEERNPLKTNTSGTGELIADAIKKGARKILLGIGGSATNDAGMGMAAALGWRFLSKTGEELQPAGESLEAVEEIIAPSEGVTASHTLTEVEVEVICDVTNPLFGPDGAAHVYARQKGADDAGIARLDAGLRHFSKKLEAHFGKNFAEIPGSGAAGGLGAGAMAFLGAKLRPGIEAVMELTGFEEVLKNADLVITGEGKLDGQTMHGKLIHGICKKAAKHGVPVIAFCGTLEAEPEAIAATGLRAAFSILRKPQTLAEAIDATEEGLECMAYNVLKIMDLSRQ
jgi:glycerate 2-kinase